MGVSSASADLRAVRQDLDLPAAGSITERAVMNKICRQSPPVDLASFKGNILGTQLLIKNIWGGSAVWEKKRDHTTGHFYISPQGGTTGITGDRLQVNCTSQDAYDIGMELRILGKVTEDGTYRFSGKSFGRFAGNFNYMHIYLITNSLGYLNGVNNLVLQNEYSSAFADGEKSWSFNVSLSTTQPYVTAIFRNVFKAYSYGDNTTMDFWDWKLEKV